jgi:hypothetical protein
MATTVVTPFAASRKPVSALSKLTAGALVAIALLLEAIK